MQIKTKIVSCHTAGSKTVKQEANGTVILPPLVFPGLGVSKIVVARWQHLSGCFVLFTKIKNIIRFLRDRRCLLPLCLQIRFKNSVEYTKHFKDEGQAFQGFSIIYIHTHIHIYIYIYIYIYNMCVCVRLFLYRHTHMTLCVCVCVYF